tara:strand:- start:789 stop:1505 length:717 start_codon:yes stop_codon:yes gene_type:complete
MANKNKLLIIGSPRSGTQFTTYLLKYLGFRMGHEESDVDGCVSSLHLTVPKEFTTVLHQMREPLQTISSLHKIDWADKETMAWIAESGYSSIVNNNLRKSANYVARHETWNQMLDKIKDGHGTRKCMKAYLEWNKYCLRASSWSYKLEDLTNPDIFKEWITNIALPSTRDSEDLWERACEFSTKYKDMDKISKDAYSSGFGPPITWEVLDKLDSEVSKEIKSLVSPYYLYDDEGKLID